MNILQGTNDGMKLEFSKQEMLIVLGAIREVLECLDWDFHIRMGVSKAEAEELLGEITRAYDQAFPEVS